MSETKIVEICIYEQGIENYPKRTVVLANLAMITWVALGTISCWFLVPLAAWIYLPVAVVMVWVVLRRLVCIDCYYYGKWCGTGWGKLSAVFFKQGSLECFATGIGVKLAPITYGLLSLIPLVLVIIALIQAVTVAKIVVLMLLLLMSVYSGFISRQKSCVGCKMRLMCPGTTAKGE
ncbi:MAG: hypothetical protein JSV77_07685 [Dehalococcoidales bacterium]|nr:MAG: hypothetical protein JSV77_07685 [Dehalococcoidales bacterium]